MAPAGCTVTESELVTIAREVFRDCGLRLDLCLGPLDDEERAIREVSDDQAIAVGYAVQGERAGYRPLEQTLASDFASALRCLRLRVPSLKLGPDGKVLVVVRGRALAGVSVSVHHAPGTEWMTLASTVIDACKAVASEYVDAGELDRLGDVDWLVNGAGAFEIGGPEGDNGLSGKKLVAQAYGTAVPIGGGAVFGKDPLKVDPRGQRLARRMALELVKSGAAREATVWMAWRPGDIEPRWVETVLDIT